MKTTISKALQEVWEMKNAAYEETKHLKGSAYFSYIHEQVTRDFPQNIFVAEAGKTKSAAYKIANDNTKFLSPSIAESK